MLKRNLNLKNAMRVALYLRMSSDRQNPRSPQQQQDTIEAIIKSMGLPWTIEKVYTDEGISGRYIKKRPAFQRMLREIRSQELIVDAILVDTFERFGRNEDLLFLRQELDRDNGVLVLTADTQFADPTTTSGKAMAAFESLRATEDNRIKAHNVLRGKRDAVQQGHWVGGKPPFGYMLKTITSERAGRLEIDHRILVPDPESSGIVKRLFELAEQGTGCTSIARILNADSAIPDKFKPFYEQTINFWLRSQIYFGQQVWEKRATGVVNDRRLSQRNADEDRVVVPNFCEPLITKELWEKVHELRAPRRLRIEKALKAKKEASGKKIVAVGGGYALKYPLSGLIFCGTCRRAMNVSVSPTYRTKDGQARTYVSYSCPGYMSRVCTNRKRVSEAELRSFVVELIHKRLFSKECGDIGKLTLADLQATEWFPRLLESVRLEVQKQSSTRHDIRPTLEKDLANLQLQIQGWTQSLGNPSLDPGVRAVIEQQFQTGLRQKKEVEAQLMQLDGMYERANSLVDPEEVVERLNRLAVVLEASNASRTNLELSLHIEKISCFPNGSAIVRTCKLGALAECVEVVAQIEQDPTEANPLDDRIIPGVPRNRILRQLGDHGGDRQGMLDIAHFATDINRFAGLGPEWFWEDTFLPKPKTYWFQDHAAAVASKVAEGLRIKDLCAHFQKSPPTIRKALRFAQERLSDDNKPSAA